MSLSGNVDALATRIAQEFNIVRGEFSATEFLTQAEYDAIATPDPGTLYVITDTGASDVQTGSGSGTLTIDASLGSLYDYTATGDVTVAPPTNGTNRRPVRLAVLASGADRAVTFDGLIRTSTGVTSGPYTVPSGEVLLAAIEYVSLRSAWVLTAVTTTE